MKKKEIREKLKDLEAELRVTYQKLDMPIFDKLGRGSSIAIMGIRADILNVQEELKYMEI